MLPTANSIQSRAQSRNHWRDAIHHQEVLIHLMDVAGTVVARQVGGRLQRSFWRFTSHPRMGQHIVGVVTMANIAHLQGGDSNKFEVKCGQNTNQQMANEIFGIGTDVFPLLVRKVEVSALDAMEQSSLAVGTRFTLIPSAVFAFAFTIKGRVTTKHDVNDHAFKWGLLMDFMEIFYFTYPETTYRNVCHISVPRQQMHPPLLVP